MLKTKLRLTSESSSSKLGRRLEIVFDIFCLATSVKSAIITTTVILSKYKYFAWTEWQRLFLNKTSLLMGDSDDFLNFLNVIEEGYVIGLLLGDNGYVILIYYH